MLVFLLPVALAAAPAHYHPDAIAARSTRFAAASEAVGPRFDEVDRAVSRTAGLVRDLETATAMLGSTASEGLTAWTVSNRRAFAGQYLLLNRAVGAVQEDFSTAFGEALERALPAASKGFDVKECGASGIAAMMRRPSCEGEDLNPALAAALDADAALAARLDEITGRAWPEVRLEPSPQEVVPISGTARSIQLAAVANKFLGARLRAHADELDATLEQLQDRLDAGDAAARAKAEQARADMDAAVARDGEALRAAVAASLERNARKGAPAEVGWCANPTPLGGCVGEDVTAAVAAILAGDKKFLAEIAPLTK